MNFQLSIFNFPLSNFNTPNLAVSDYLLERERERERERETHRQLLARQYNKKQSVTQQIPCNLFTEKSIFWRYNIVL